MSPIFIPRAPAERPQLLSGVTTGLQTLMPWERLDNPVLDKFMLPGSEEFSPNALKERAKVNVRATTFAPSGQEGGGGGGSGGKSGGGGVSYMPGGSPIGKGRPKAWSAPQQNFEDAKGKGELTPEKVKQAQDFAAAYGRTFDPTLGYSTNTRPAAQAPQQSQPGTPASPSTTPQVGVPAVPAKPVNEQPTGYGQDGMPINGQKRDNWKPGNVRDENGPVLTAADKAHGVESYDKNGVAQYAFAGGTPGVPVKALKGKPFWVGEEGPELARVKDGKLTVVPNHEIKAAGVTPPKPRRAWAFADMAEGRGFADGTGTDPTQTMEDRQSWSPVFAPTNGPVLRTAPSADRVVATPATPQTAFPTQSTEQGFTPAFSPTFAPTLSAPPGVRQTDFRRFLRTPQGMQYALGHEAQNQSSAAHNQSRTAAMNTERGWQMEDKKSHKDEVDQAIADEVAGQRAAHAALGGTLDPITEQALGRMKPQAQSEFFKHTITATAQKRHADDAEKRRTAEMDARSLDHVVMMPSPDGSGNVPAVVDKSGNTRMAGGFQRTKGQGQGQPGIRILGIPGTKHGVPYYDDGSGAPPRPLAGGHVFEGDEQSGWKMLNADKPVPAPPVRNAGTAAAPNMQQWNGQKWEPFNPAGAPPPPSDTEKVTWMQQNGHKPDKNGQYSTAAWSQAYRALKGGGGSGGEGGYFDRLK